MGLAVYRNVSVSQGDHKELELLVPKKSRRANEKLEDCRSDKDLFRIVGHMLGRYKDVCTLPTAISLEQSDLFCRHFLGWGGWELTQSGHGRVEQGRTNSIATLVLIFFSERL